VGEARAHEAVFAGAGDVDQVRLEASECLFDDGDVARKGGIKAEVFFDGEGEKAARKFEGPEVAVFYQFRLAVAGAHAEEGEVAAAGKGLKVAAGVGNAVDLVE